MIPRSLIDYRLSGLPRVDTDVVVIGGGIAGLFTAVKAAERERVLVITKKTLFESNTRHAQGGIAAVISDDDSPEFHLEDTLAAGAGLCRPEAVRVLVTEGPACIHELVNMGTHFDIENGTFALTQEGAHSHRRILHANGDATGAEIVRALSERARMHPNIGLWDNHFVVDLVSDGEECYGAIVLKPDGGLVFVAGKATVLASGGAGQLYRYTTNPDVATGDGLAMAYRAGARLRDVEFIQFHPTALCYPGAPRFLISEAVRGEGAVLRNIKGERFMERYHPLRELAPRDVVARAIVAEMERTNATFVYLDITHEPADTVRHRFPTIYETCLQYGLDLTADWIPVAPAAHYMMGGVRTDLDGATNVRRLFACGEVSSTGVHGANRLASNSLSEAVVFGRRITERIRVLKPASVPAAFGVDLGRRTAPEGDTAEQRLRLQKTMLRHVGLKRSGSGLEKGIGDMRRQLPFMQRRLATKEQFEYANMLTCSLLSAQAALARTESRGGHYREDCPERDDRAWRKHLLWHIEEGMTEEPISDV
jgi:L-aspartate oxidase